MYTYNLKDQIIVASVVGITSCCTTFLCSLTTPIRYTTDWRDIAFYGTIGSILASKYIIKALK